MIFFVHHIARSVQADVIVTKLGNELNAAILSELKRGGDKRKWMEDGPVTTPGGTPDPNLQYVVLNESGYISTIDESGGLDVAVKHDIRIHGLCRPGHYMLAGVPVVSVNDGKMIDDKVVGDIRSIFTVSAWRTRMQHIDFEMHALVEVALRALSPGVTDPFTALTRIDRLTDSLARLLAHGGSLRMITDGNGVCRVVLYPLSFQHYLDTAFLPIRQTAAGNTAIMLRLLNALRQLALRTTRQKQIQELLDHCEVMEQAGCAAASIEHDANQIRARAGLVQELARYRFEKLRENRVAEFEDQIQGVAAASGGHQ